MHTAKTLHRTEIPHGGAFLQTLRNLLSDLEAGWRAFRVIRSRRKAAMPDPRTREIDSLYRDLHELMEEKPSSSDLIERKLGRLRELQQQEAAEMRKLFESSLSLPAGSGLAAIREAKRLLGRDEDSPSENPASFQHD